MNPIETLAKNGRIQAALASFHDRLPQIIEQAIAIQQIPAPTFAEKERANYVQQQFLALGLSDVSQDELGNVYGRYPASQPLHLPVILSAHTDTVFPADTDLTVRREGSLIYGPGLGDNAMGVAGLLLLLQTLRDFSIRPFADLWFVANVGEEGLGDLRGMRAVVERFGREACYIVVEGGLYGRISHQAIGVRRFRIHFTTPGGHSWGNFGTPSAIHELGHFVAALDGLEVPTTPKTTYNAGVITGGTSVNSIAHSATLWLDLRSEEPAELLRLEQTVVEMVKRANGRKEGVAVTMTQIGDRPAGYIPRHTPLVVWAEAALRQVGCPEISYLASSTDANIPLSLGLSAVCIGLTQSGNSHRPDEYINPTHLPNGLGQLLLLTLAAAGQRLPNL